MPDSDVARRVAMRLAGMAYDTPVTTESRAQAISELADALLAGGLEKAVTTAHGLAHAESEAPTARRRGLEILAALLGEESEVPDGG